MQPVQLALGRSERLANELCEEQLQRDAGVTGLAPPVLSLCFRRRNGSQRTAANVAARCRPAASPRIRWIPRCARLTSGTRPRSSAGALCRVEVPNGRLLRRAHLKKKRLRNKSTALTTGGRQGNLRGAKTTSTIRRYDHRLEPTFPHRWPTSVWWVVFANSRQAVERLRWGLFCPQRLQGT